MWLMKYEGGLISLVNFYEITKKNLNSTLGFFFKLLERCQIVNWHLS